MTLIFFIISLILRNQKNGYELLDDFVSLESVKENQEKINLSA